jgi:hypothetical protein
MSGQLPGGFEVLEPFVAQWAVSGTANRAHCRDESTPAERVAFYETAKGLVPQALEKLDAVGLAGLGDKQQRLLDLLCSFAHVTLAVEMLGDAEPRHAQFRKRMRFTRSPADVAA